MLIELAWFSHRAVWHLIFGGVLERHPNLRIVLTEQGTGWIPRGVDTLDWFHRRMTHGGAAEAVFFGAVAKAHVVDAERVLPAATSGSARASCVRRRARCATRSASIASCGAPTTRTPRARTRTRPRRCASRSRRARPTETRLMLETTAAEVYGFDLDALRADRRPGRPDRRRGARCRSTPPTIPPTRRATPSTRSRSSSPGSAAALDVDGASAVPPHVVLVLPPFGAAESRRRS